MPDPEIAFEELFKYACDFQSHSLQARAENLEKYKTNETNQEFYIRAITDGLMARLARNLESKVENVTEAISYQIILTVSFIRSYYIINDMIMHGDLIEASTLLRKQLESLTRLHELDGLPLKKLLRKTPDVIRTFKTMGKQAYPHLSEIAHFASPKAGELLSILEKQGGMLGPSITPDYTPAAHGCFDMQVLISSYFLFWLIEKQKAFYSFFDGEAEEALLMNIFTTAVEAGIIRVDRTREDN